MEPKMGVRIREVRKAFGLTQEEFSKRSGISLSSIKRYEANERQPNMDQIDQMAAAVELTRGEFLWSFETNEDAEKEYQAFLKEHASKVFREDPELIEEFSNVLWFLNKDGRQTALERTKELTEISEYQRWPGRKYGDYHLEGQSEE